MSIWTDELTKRVSRLWNEGRSMGEISVITGVSRNAIAGKLNRTGLMGDIAGRNDIKSYWDKHTFEPYSERKARKARGAQK